MSAHTRRQTVRVSEQATRVFLYGKPILGDSVKSFDPRLNPGDVCIVSNPRWEAIGLGEVMGRFKGDRPAVRAVHDLGTYLRDQDRD
jgi:ribosome biogenesis protein Nip4